MTAKIDVYSPTWLFVEDWLKADLASSREANDSYKKSELDTALLRGRIKLLKEILELPLPPKRDRERVIRNQESE